MTGIAFIDEETGEVVLHHRCLPDDFRRSTGRHWIEGRRCYARVFGSASCYSYERLWDLCGASVRAAAQRERGTGE